MLSAMDELLISISLGGKSHRIAPALDVGDRILPNIRRLTQKSMASLMLPNQSRSFTHHQPLSLQRNDASTGILAKATSVLEVVRHGVEPPDTS